MSLPTSDRTQASRQSGHSAGHSRIEKLLVSRRNALNHAGMVGCTVTPETSALSIPLKVGRRKKREVLSDEEAASDGAETPPNA
jgi:hypothetical protein